jgi:tetratricopeptide (TPR) repeat protein
MADSPRIEDLRRRVQKDPASIAFAQLAEECRRAGQYQESIDVCRAGLALHPGYLSARVTLGRALIEIDQLDEAQTELELVLAGASDNLAAIRGLAEIFHRRGALADALRQYRAALALARNDPDLERTVTELSRAIEPKPPAPAFDGLSFEQMADEFMKNLPAPPPPVAVAPVVEPVVEVAPVMAAPVTETAPVVEGVAGVEAEPLPAVEDLTGGANTFPAETASPVDSIESQTEETTDPTASTAEASPSLEEGGSDTVSDSGSDTAGAVVLSESPLAAAADAALTDEDAAPPVNGASRAHAQATIAALDQWLDAIHVACADRRP